MTATTFDTRTAAKALEATDFTEPQAAAIVDMVRDAMADGVATKADLRAGLADLRVEIGALEARMTTRLYAVAGAIVAAVGLFNYL